MRFRCGGALLLSDVGMSRGYNGMLGGANRAAVLHVRSHSANGTLLPSHAAYVAYAERGEAARVQAVEASDPPPPVGAMARLFGRHRSGARRLGQRQAAMVVLESS